MGLLVLLAFVLLVAGQTITVSRVDFWCRLASFSSPRASVRLLSHRSLLVAGQGTRRGHACEADPDDKKKRFVEQTGFPSSCV